MKLGYLGVILILIGIVIISGCTNPIDPKEQAKERARQTFNDCNQRCGEGILSPICKEKCTYDYNQRLSDIERGNY